MAYLAEEKGRTERYLPEKAWDKLTPEQRKETDEKKKAASRKGKQFVPNTEAARKAGRAARMYKEKRKNGQKETSKTSS